MTWKVLLHPLVLKEDLPGMDHSGRQAVLCAIRKKLAADPQAYGEPLRRELFGYWKLRVGEYRVIYRVQKEVVTVLVVKIGMRKDSQVYSEMFARLKKNF